MPSNISAGRFTVMDVNQPSTIKAANIDINNNIGASCLSLILKKYDNIVIIIVVSVLISSLVINIVEY